MSLSYAIFFIFFFPKIHQKMLLSCWLLWNQVIFNYLRKLSRIADYPIILAVTSIVIGECEKIDLKKRFAFILLITIYKQKKEKKERDQ